LRDHKSSPPYNVTGDRFHILLVTEYFTQAAGVLISGNAIYSYIKAIVNRIFLKNK